MNTILITEGKSNNPEFSRGVVRVFINQDYDYGYFISENIIFQILNEEQRLSYNNQDKFQVSDVVVQIIEKMGLTHP